MKVSSDEHNQLSHDDMDMLQHVLQNVRGSYPDQPYRQDLVDSSDLDFAQD